MDNAYGVPFPNIIFEDVEPFWNENTILCMSLSNSGFQGVRCGIVIANEQVTEALSNMNGIISLAPGSIGPPARLTASLKKRLAASGEEVIKPLQTKITACSRASATRLSMIDVSTSQNRKALSSYGYGLMNCQLPPWNFTNASKNAGF